MIRLNHIFALEFRNAEGQVLHQVPVAANWESATEWARFEAMRRAPVEHWPELAAADAEILPIGNGTDPYAQGVRIIIHGHLPGPSAAELPITWFDRMARSALANLIQESKLTHEPQPAFRLLAFEQTQLPSSPLPAFGVEELPVALPVLAADLTGLAAPSRLVGEAHPGEFPVFISPQILEEAAQQTIAADANETGGVLLGCLVHDRRAQETGLVITALIPARYTDAQCESLTFTAETWSAVSAAVTLRHEPAEMICGWYHSHPSKFWCLKCPEERRRVCPLQQEGFLSAQDLSLHETLFPKPFQVALLTTNAQAGLRHNLFGSWQGQLRERAFYQLEALFTELLKRQPDASLAIQY